MGAIRRMLWFLVRSDHRWVHLALVAAFLASTVALRGSLSVASAATPLHLPTGFVDELAIGGLLAPRAFTFVPDGRVFVVERGSASSNDINFASVRVFKNGALLPA